MQDSDRRNSSRRSSADRDFSPIDETVQEGYVEERTPRFLGCLFALINALIIALPEGLIAVTAPIGIIYANASLYTQSASPDANIALGAAFTLFLWGIIGLICSGFIIFLLTTLMTLFYAKSRQGCLVGILAGGCTYGWLFVAPYVFHLPGTISSSTKTSADGSWYAAPAGLVVIAIGLVFYMGAGGVGNISGRALGSWLSGRIIKKLQGKG